MNSLPYFLRGKWEKSRKQMEMAASKLPWKFYLEQYYSMFSGDTLAM